MDKLEGILGPLAEELHSQQSTFPLVLIYGKLETISCFAFFSRKFGEMQYEPFGEPPVASHIYCSHNTMYNTMNHERDKIVNEPVKGNQN